MVDLLAIAGSFASILGLYKDKLKGGFGSWPRAERIFLTRLPNPNLRHVQDRIKDIEAELNKKKNLVLKGRGGVGKTSLALEYAHQRKSLYAGGVYWVDAYLGLAWGYRDLGRRMGSSVGREITEETSDDQLVSLMNEFLSLSPLKLVVLDDLQAWGETDGCLPGDNCHLLFTTRTKNPPQESQEIALPSEEQAQDIFLAYAGWQRETLTPDQARVTAAVCDRVECLPLALEILGRVAASTPPAGFLEELDQVMSHRALTHTKADKTLLAALDMAERRYGHERALDGLKVAGYLDPEHVEAELVGLIMEVPLKEARAVLRALAEVSALEVGRREYTVHRLIQEAAREMDQDKAVGERVVKVLDGLIQAVSDKGEYRKAYSLIPHLLHIAPLAEGVEDTEAFPPTYPLTRWAEYLWNSGIFSSAEAICRSCLARLSLIKGEEHADYCASLNNLALMLAAQGKYTEAEVLYRRVIKIDENALGTKRMSYATYLNNLAGVLRDQGEHVEAERIYRRALVVAENTIGSEHPDYATHLSNLAAVIQAQGKFAEAEGLFRRAIEIDEKTIGEEHPQHANHLNNLAEVLHAQGKFAEAEDLNRRVLEIDEKALGLEHPGYAIDLNNLAGVLKDQGKLAEAEELYCQALEIAEKTIGKEHPGYAIHLNNLAEVFHAQGNYAEAERHYRRALEIDENIIGTEHSGYAIDLNNLAGVLEDQGKFADAQVLFRRALDISLKALGTEHPQTMTIQGNLDHLLVKLKK